MSEFFVYSFFFGMLFFVFPIFVEVDGYLDPTINKLYFSLSVFKIRVFGGYAELRKDGIAVHLTETKAKFVYYSKMADAKKMFEITQGFQLCKFHQVIETGGARQPLTALFVSAIQSTSGTLFGFYKTKHPFMELKNDVLLSPEPCLKVTVRFSLVFNGLVVAIAMTKKLLEGIINWIRKRKSIRYSKKQPSN